MVTTEIVKNYQIKLFLQLSNLILSDSDKHKNDINILKERELTLNMCTHLIRHIYNCTRPIYNGNIHVWVTC